MDNIIHPVDRHIGARLKALRKAKGLSLITFADPLDVSWQQISKYESGFNRISASRLYEMARVLSVPVSDFFAGLPQVEPAEEPKPKSRRAA